jgi:tetratricopeptide (TPR) repeat protein
MKRGRARSSKAKGGRKHRFSGGASTRQLANTSGNRNITIQVQGITFNFVAPTYLARPLLHQLRPPPGDFTGRNAELDTLRSAVSGAGTGQAILGIFGAGGTGKTTLAEQLCPEIESNYPDAQIYLDLKGLSTPLPAREAMRWVIRSMTPGATLPDDEPELVALYRETLHGKRVLLLMDNASTQEQVQPLVPGAGSLLLITSQTTFSLPGLVSVRIGELEDREAQQLLLRICPRIGDAAAELAALCGRRPLALRVAGSVLAGQADLSPSAYARGLADGRETLDVVDASFEVSCQTLPDELRRLWQLLAMFPRAFSAKPVAFVWQLERTVAEAALRKLAVRNLIEYDPSSSRYWLHDLTRSFLGRRLDAAERSALERRHAVYYLALLEFAAVLYWRGRMGDDLLALGVFDTEWDNIRAGQQWASTHAGDDDPSAAEICSRYSSVSAHFLFLRLNPQERIGWHEAALVAARRTGDRAAEAVHLGQLGTDYREIPDLAAIELFEQQLEVARDCGDHGCECGALGNLGSTYLELLGDADRAYELFDQALQVARRNGLRSTEGIILHNLGLVALERGDHEQARAFLEQDLAIAREGGNSSHIAHSLASLGTVRKDMGETEAALKLYDEALPLAKAIRDWRSQSSVLADMAIIFRERQEPDRAIQHFEDAVAVARQGKYLGREAWAKWNLGLLYDEAGDFTRAVELMQMKVDLERRVGHREAEKHAALVESIRAKLAPAAAD